MGLTAVLKRTINALAAFRPRDLVVARHDGGHHPVDHVTSVPFFRNSFEHAEFTKSTEVPVSEKSTNTSADETNIPTTDKKTPTIIQLFYDLFFVANLTAFNSVHEVNDVSTLKSYIGFFSILWFTWLQVAMFDVRFSSDSVFERVCKALQLGVMLGLAIVGPAYNVDFDSGIAEDDSQNLKLSIKAFRTLSFILMFSRLVLCVQYGAVLIWCRKFRGGILPLTLTIVTNFVTAMVFLGLFFAFKDNDQSSLKAVDGWYVIVGIEAALMLFFSTIHRFASFRQSYIVERLGLLTLILLGEGVIGLCSAIQKVSTSQTFSSEGIGMIVCAAVIIYFLWVFYFDQVEAEKVGTLRQLVWILLHFPYHVSVLLVLEGTSQMISWQKILDVWNKLGEDLFDYPDIMSNSRTDLQSVVQYLNTTVHELAKEFTPPGKLRLETPYVNDTLTEILNLADDTMANGNYTYTNATLSQYVLDIYYTCAVYTAEHLGFEPPLNKVNLARSDVDIINDGLNDTFNTVFGYFFFCAGTVLLFNGLLFIFGKRHKLRGEYLESGIRIVIGIGMAVVALLSFDMDDNVSDAYNTFELSPWMLPTVALTYLVVIMVDILLIWSMRRTLRRYIRG